MSSEEQRATGIQVNPGGASGRRAGRVLPEPLTSLIGRDAEIDELRQLLDSAETRLLTLTGPGGVGKSRLALAIAPRASQDFADGVCYLPLAPIGDSGSALPALARALGMTQGSELLTGEQVAQALRGRHLLLVLDSFEHLLAEPPIFRRSCWRGARASRCWSPVGSRLTSAASIVISCWRCRSRAIEGAWRVSRRRSPSFRSALARFGRISRWTTPTAR